MLQETYMRMRKIARPEDIFVVTNREYVPEVEKELLEFPKENILAEPVGAVPLQRGLSRGDYQQKVRRRDYGVFAADHFIENPELLLEPFG